MDWVPEITPRPRRLLSDHNRPRRSRPADFAFCHPLMPGSDRNEVLSCDAVNAPLHFRSENYPVGEDVPSFSNS